MSACHESNDKPNTCQTNTSSACFIAVTSNINERYKCISGNDKNTHLSVRQHLETQAALKVKHNCDVLRSMLKIIIFCGKQNIALRGHRERFLYTEESTQDTNSGNFLALLTLLANSGDVTLQEHIKSAPKNTQYWSPDIQNDLFCAVEQ